MIVLYDLLIGKFVAVMAAACLYLGLIIWVDRDARARGLTPQPWNTLCLLLPVIGCIVYLCARGRVGGLEREVPLEEAPTDDAVSLMPVAQRGVALGQGASADDVILLQRSGHRITERKRRRGGVTALGHLRGLIATAIAERATDIHLELGETEMRTRFRIDGVLHDGLILQHNMGRSVVSAVKAAAEIDIPARGHGLEGTFRACLGSEQYDLRVASTASSHGETMAIRVLDRRRGLLGLEGLGLSPELVARLERELASTHGLVVASGPTGSGKTTTLYACLARVDTVERNVTTIEDPVEYELPGVTQIPVNRRAGMDFAEGLRSVLRQDPDVVMVGEVRDQETAKTATQAAVAGHLVLSTLHGASVFAALGRLRALGIDSHTLASAVRLVICQRLVRVLCSDCRELRKVTPAAFSGLDMAPSEMPASVFFPHGCPNCNRSGYRSRTGVFEVLIVSDEVRDLISKDAPDSELLAAAKTAGMLTLKQDGIAKLREGVTSIEEIRKAIA